MAMDMKDMKPEGHPEGCRCAMCQGLPGQGGKCEICGEKHCPYHGFGWGHGYGCGYGGCGFGYRRHVLLRVIFAVIIAFVIFWIGARVGAWMFGGYGPGYGMMYRDYGHAYPMMGYWENGYYGNATSSTQ